MRDSFIFYKTFFDCIKELPQKNGYALYNAIFEYIFNEKEPSLNGIEKGIFSMIKAQIDANNRRYENGKKGGRPKKNKTSGFENNNQVKTDGFEKGHKDENQNETNPKPNVNDNVNENVNENDKNTLCKADAHALFEKVWKLYPVKKGKAQVSLAARQRLLKVGYDELVRAIDRYKADLERDSDWRNPQNGSTFFNSGYVDYLDANYVPEEEKKPKQRKNQFNSYPQRQMSKSQMNDLEKQLLGR